MLQQYVFIDWISWKNIDYDLWFRFLWRYLRWVWCFLINNFYCQGTGSTYLIFCFSSVYFLRKKLRKKENTKKKKAYTEVSYQLIKTKHRGNCQGLLCRGFCTLEKKCDEKVVWDLRLFNFYFLQRLRPIKCTLLVLQRDR